MSEQPFSQTQFLGGVPSGQNYGKSRFCKQVNPQMK